MYILLDLKRMCVVHRHEKVEALRSLAQIEVAHTPVTIFDEDRPNNWVRFTDLELKLVYENANGEKWPAHAKLHFATVMELVRRIPPSAVDQFEAYLQANCISKTDVHYYRYAPGCNKPEQLADLFVTVPRLAAPKVAQVLPPTPALPTPPRPGNVPPQAPIQAPTPAKPPPKIPPPWL